MVPSLFDVSGRRILVTGSSRGIGYALAEGLGKHGATIVLNGRDAVSLGNAVRILSGRGVAASFSVFDATDADAARREIDRIETDTGPIDVLVNNAGMQYRQPLETFPTDKWDLLLRTNLSSAFYVGQSVARHMIARGQGRIINICSVTSELGRASIAPYAASKGALKMLTKGMAIEWGRHGIRVNGIGPGYFKTDLNASLVADSKFSGWLEQRTPLGRWGEVEELVGAALFLASHASSFVTGQILYVDGGITSSL